MYMNDNHKDLSELIELYVLGGLSPSEAAELEDHLKQCPSCSEQVSGLREITGLLPLTSESAAPSAGTKDRIPERIHDTDYTVDSEVEETNQEVSDVLEPTEPLAQVNTNEPVQSINTEEALTQQEIVQPSPLPPLGQLEKIDNPDGFLQPVRGSRKSSSRSRSRPRSRSGLGLRILSALLAVAIVILGIYSVQLNRKVNELQLQADLTTTMKQQLQQSEHEASEMQSKLASALKPTQGLKLREAIKFDPASQDIEAQGMATIVVDSQGTHLVVQAEKLPQLQDKEAFQVWLIKGDVKHNAGTFLSHDGTGALYYTFEPGDYKALAITLEPDAYGEQPRGKVILEAEFRASI